ncbi:MAG: DNA-processing protein DprA [Gammaproteobacteria bacterium]
MTSQSTAAIIDQRDLDEHQLTQWLTLHHASGFGPARLQTLLDQQIDPLELLGPQQKTLFAHITLAEKTRHALVDPDQTAIDRDLQWARQHDCYIIPLLSSWYPAQLREISDPPVLLYVQGDPEILHYPQLAMVGSRNPGHTGRETAFEFARHLSRAGLIINSGMAGGIDTESHRGALQGSGLTVAVTGTGLDIVYPAKNRPLAKQIAAQGALVSEYPVGTRPAAHNFPRRNRIISGLSAGTLVVEAALQSGSLITAKQAMEQGREVFAIPGSIHNPLAKGCHHLIRQGAKLVETGDDVLQELAPVIARHRHTALQPSNENLHHNKDLRATARKTIDARQQQLLDCMAYEPVSVDTLVQRSRLTPESISSMLVELELSGLITSSGGLYSRL